VSVRPEARGRVLFVDDDPAMGAVMRDGLARMGFEVRTEADPRAALALVEREELDAVVTDLRMGALDGLSLCRALTERRPQLPVIVLTAFGSYESAVAAMRAGAHDFLDKPVDVERLALSLQRAVELRRLREEVRRLRDDAGRLRGYGEMCGESPAMLRVHDLLDRVRDSDVTVLVTGESGTGKELVARALHRLGRRAGGPFVAVNCAALSESLLESELFGHAKGAFTDARAARPGLLVEAHGGTLFLDEVGEMSLGMQVKLLRALQDRRVRPVGGSGEVPFDARVVAATHRDLRALIEAGSFREDLYFRLAVLEIEVPPLRARGGDVLLLAQRFVEEAAARTGKQVVGLSAEAAARLAAYPFPGNVRELANSMERAVAVTRHDRVGVEDLPERIAEAQTPGADPGADAVSPAPLLAPLEEVERRHVLRVLDAVQGRRADAAEILGIDRKTLYRKLERWGRND